MSGRRASPHLLSEISEYATSSTGYQSSSALSYQRERRMSLIIPQNTKVFNNVVQGQAFTLRIYLGLQVFANPRKYLPGSTEHALGFKAQARRSCLECEKCSHWFSQLFLQVRFAELINRLSVAGIGSHGSVFRALLTCSGDVVGIYAR